MTRWGGRRAQAWTAAVLAKYGNVCHLQLDGCTQVATTGDHLIPRSVRPDLEYDVDNGRPACVHCNCERKAAPLRPRPVVDARDFFESRATTGKHSVQSPPRSPRKIDQRPIEPSGARP